MRKHWSYVRAVALSVLAALVIDGIINFDEYKESFLVEFQQHDEEQTTHTAANVPLQIGRAGAIAVGFILQETN